MTKEIKAKRQYRISELFELVERENPELIRRSEEVMRFGK